MPLSMVNSGNSVIITGFNGKDNIKRYLESLGLVIGTVITVISETQGSLIICVKNARLAINKGIAQRLVVEDIDKQNINNICQHRKMHRHRRCRRGMQT